MSAAQLNNPLFVPLEVEALAVNTKVLTNNGVNIQRWRYSYINLRDFISPQPVPFTSNNSPFPGTGIMLHWTLPEIIRNGRQNAITGDVDFPLAPNRWVVVRYSGPLTARTSVAWVVESDYLSNTVSDGGADYLEPGSDAVDLRWVGRVVSLNNWNNPVTPTLFLTAVGPGNTSFASYQPYCENVFSMFDPLDGVADIDTISYCVAGWYSDPAADILTEWEKKVAGNPDAFQDFIAEANWRLTEEAITAGYTANQGIYHSMVWGIEWDKNGAVYNNVPDGTKAKVAIGNTAVDALTALIQKQVEEQKSDVDPDILEALQYGLLPAYDQQDAAFELKQNIEQSWFGYRSGGFGWEIVYKPVPPDKGDPPPPVSPAELEKEEAWLATLNAAQAQYDKAQADLIQMQWNLYQVWWKGKVAAQKYPTKYPKGTTEQEFKDALDGSIPTSLVSQVKAQLELINELAKTIPTGKTQLELAASILVYSEEKELPDTRELRQFALRPFSNATEPVVLIQGMEVDATLKATSALLCRFKEELVTGFYFDEKGAERTVTLNDVKSVISIPANISSVPALVENLLYECFLLDPKNSKMIAQVLGISDPAIILAIEKAMTGGKQVVGTCPDIQLEKWTQPWLPLIMSWEIEWLPILHADDNGKPLWTFDGNDYTWGGQGFKDTAPRYKYSGMIFLTPQAQFNFREQLTSFIRENPGITSAEKFDQFVLDTDGWDFLSQSLVGITQNELLRIPSTNVSARLDTTEIFPGITLSDLVGVNGNYVPLAGAPQPPRSGTWPPSGFQDWRAGQFHITNLMIADRFGQTSEIVNTQTQENFKPYISKPLIPQIPVMNQSPLRFVQLPPRLLQPARLNFDFVSAEDDAAVAGMDENANPVCAWLLHNFLDESIMTYDKKGFALGQVLLVTNTANEKVMQWEPAPDSIYKTIEDLLDNPELVHLGEMLVALKALKVTAFESLLETIDASSWVIEGDNPTPDQGLAMLAGNPFALVRTRLNFSLESSPLTDPSWRYTFAPIDNPAMSWPYNIRLGEGGMQQDGLIGYFKGDNYDSLYAPNVPNNVSDPDYIVAVGTGADLSLTFADTDKVYMTMLMDPRAVVHATTGITPVINVSIPQPYVNDAFANMRLLFTVGPLLSDTQQPEDDLINPSSVILSRPVVKNGTWDWMNYDGENWNAQPVVPAEPTAQFSNFPALLRTGLLRLSGAVDLPAAEKRKPGSNKRNGKKKNKK